MRRGRRSFLTSEAGGLSVRVDAAKSPAAAASQPTRQGELLGFLVGLVLILGGWYILDAFRDLQNLGIPILLYFLVVIATASVGGFRPSAAAIIVMTLLTWQRSWDVIRSLRFALAQVELWTIAIVFETLRRATLQARREASERRDGEERYRLLFEGNPHPMWVYDVETLKFLAVNDAALKKYGYTRPEFLAMTILDIRDSSAHAAVRAAVRSVGERQANQTGPWRHRTKLGAYIDTEVTSTSISFAGKRARLVLSNDVTERLRAERERDRIHLSEEHARREAEAANEAKDRFIATLSHELRTPLSPILAGVGALLREKTLDPEVRGVLEITQRNVELESRLIEDLLDAGRVREGKLSLKSELTDLDELVDRAVETCRGDLIAARLEVAIELEATATAMVADPTRLLQVFWNLIQNAIKYTPSGGKITISTSNLGAAAQADDAEPVWRLQIRDTGLGIESELMPRIFTLFEQGSEPRVRGAAGLGIGLSIAKSIIESHGGTITAESQGKNRGAVFTIVLPLGNPNISSHVDSPRPSSELGDHGRLLLVDDDFDTTKILARLLSSQGFEVVTAASGEKALAIAEERDFDIVICDLSLPGMSGMEVMSKLTDRSKVKGLAVSGWGSGDDYEEDLIRSAGFRDHLIKPVAFDSLLNTIRRLLESE